MAEFHLKVNNKNFQVDVEPDMPLLWVLRDFIGFKGTKYGCGMGLCGACTIHINGQPLRSCQLPISGLKANDAITTIEGVEGTLGNNVQKAWIEEQVPQCGYCQSGQIMSAIALLQEQPNPGNEEINRAMSGNLCRCGTYDRIKKAIKKAALLNREV